MFYLLLRVYISYQNNKNNTNKFIIYVDSQILFNKTDSESSKYHKKHRNSQSRNSKK